MTKAIIPYNPPTFDLAPPNADFQTQNFLKNRKRVLNELRYISGIPEIASSLSQDTLYKLVCTPEGGKLYKDAAGNIKAVFYKDGKILEHAKLQAVRPYLVKAATAIGSQILLISIAMQLNRIEKGISRIINELNYDRMSEIYSGVRQYKQAMTMQDPERQLERIDKAITTLNDGIEKTIGSLKRQIEDAPEAEIGLFDNWFTNKSEIASEKFGLAEKLFRACLIGIQTLYECYVAINEPKTAVWTLKNHLKDINSGGIIELAAEKARLVPFIKGKRLPEEPWLSYLKNEPLFSDQIEECNCFANNEFDRIEIELKPNELIGETDALL